LLLAASAFGQTLLLTTTLSSALAYPTNGYSSSVTVASVSNIVAGSDIYVDQELMSVNSVPASGTTISVTRGYGGTQAQAHLKSALVFIIPAAAQPYAIVTTMPQGACARGAATITSGLPQTASTLYLPIIDTKDMVFADCLGGVFVVGDNAPAQVAQWKVLAPNSGGTAYTSLNGSGTTLVAGTLYCVEADLPYNKLLTGIADLNGTTVGTDKHLVALLDSQGNVLANSALAGAADATASVYQQYAFTSQYFAVGPAQYFACSQSNGTTDTLRMVVTGTQDTYLTTSKTGSFGTIPTITVPTTFTTAVGPYSYLY
jgi:hypothetical protein